MSFPTSGAWFKLLRGVPEVPDGYELMQFTGLHDKNGKEIYEGDIVRHRFEYEEYKNYKIVYRDAAFFADGVIPPHYFTLGKNNGFEIIGNICQNPELLTK